MSPTQEHCINFIINQKAAEHVMHNKQVVSNDNENFVTLFKYTYNSKSNLLGLSEL